MKKRRAVLIMIVVGIVALTSPLALPAMRYGYGFKDTLACIFATGRDATRYARGYSESAFGRVHPGMARAEVLQLLGQPLERISYPSTPMEMDWRYSQPASRSGHFHLRSIHFDAEGRAHKVIRGFQLD